MGLWPGQPFPGTLVVGGQLAGCEARGLRLLSLRARVAQLFPWGRVGCRSAVSLTSQAGHESAVAWQRLTACLPPALCSLCS